MIRRRLARVASAQYRTSGDDQYGVTNPLGVLRAAALSQAASPTRRWDLRQLGVAAAVLGYGGMLACWFLMRMEPSPTPFSQGDLGGFRMRVITSNGLIRRQRWVGGFGNWWLVDGLFPALIALAAVLALAIALPRKRYALGGLLAVGSSAVMAAHFYMLASSTTQVVILRGPRLTTFSRFSIAAQAAPGVWCGFACGLLITGGGLAMMTRRS